MGEGCDSSKMNELALHTCMQTDLYLHIYKRDYIGGLHRCLGTLWKDSGMILCENGTYDPEICAR